MAINEQLIPIIFESIKWVKDKMKPTKAELGLKISDLEEQVKKLSYGNLVLTKSIEEILGIVLSKLKAEGHYIINADTIIQVKDNSGQVHIGKGIDMDTMQLQCSVTKSPGMIFEGMDEEILQSKLKYPSEREEENDNTKAISR